MPVEFQLGSPAVERHVRESEEVVQRLLTFRRPYEARWDEFYRHLVSRGNDRKYPDGSPRANVFATFPFANVNFVRNTVNEALFAVDPPMETYPAGAKDEDAAQKMQFVLEKMALTDGRLRHVFNDFIGGLATYGLYALDVGWDWDVDFVYDWEDQLVQPDAMTPAGLVGRNPQTGEPLVIDPRTGMPQLRRVKVVNPVPRNRPLYTSIDIFDLAIDPDGAYVAKFFDKTVSQLERENAVAEKAGVQLYNPDAVARIKMEVFSEGDTEKTRNALVRICELWNAIDGTFTLFTTEEDITSLSFKDQRYAYRGASRTFFRRQVATQVPRTLLATGHNPYAHCRIPILYTHYTKLPGEIYGMGVIEPTYNLTEMFNNAISMIMDGWNFGVNSRFAFDATRDMDQESLQNANIPGGLVSVYGDPNTAIKELPFHPPDPASYQVLPLLQQLIENTANISNAYQRGVGATTGNRTATGISSVIQQANKGMSQLVLQICEDILQPLFAMTASNIQQFVTDEIEVRITDESPVIPKVNSQFITIHPSELAGNFDFRIVGAAYMENRFVIQNNARMLVETLAKLAPEWLKPDTGVLEMFKIHRIPYPHRFIRTAEEVELERQRQMLMAYLQAVAATRENEADEAAAQAESNGSKNGKGKGGRTMTGGPQRPMPSVDELTGMVRQFAQRSGANAMGGGGV